MLFLKDCPNLAAELYLMQASLGKRIHKHKADYRVPSENGVGTREFQVHLRGEVCDPRRVKEDMAAINEGGIMSVTEVFLSCLSNSSAPRLAFISWRVASITHAFNPNLPYYIAGGEQ